MSKINILSLDDDPKFNLFLQKKLTHGDFTVYTTETTKDFFHQFKSDLWDLCLVDLNLSEGVEAGFKVLRYIRETLKKTIPVIVISREDDHAKIIHALECGATDYISKPFDLTMFTSKAMYLLEENSPVANNLKTLPVPSTYQKCMTSFQFIPLSIAEDGITLSGTSYISKGTYIEIKKSILNSILGKDEIRLMVTQNTKRDERFTIFLEFNSDDTDLIDNAKKWLQKKTTDTK